MPTTVSAPTSIDLTISDPTLLLNEIATRYDSPVRTVMEYIDNSLDSAEALYRANGDRYPHEIRITVHIDTRQNRVTVTDNCLGMTRDTLRRIVEKVGESQKRGQTWVNGRFGFGVHAFRAAADWIRFRTRHADDALVELMFNKR